MDINFEDEIKALILMSSLPESWDIVVAANSNSRGYVKLKFDEICDVVLRESIRKREVGFSLILKIIFNGLLLQLLNLVF